jgi:hypothetical protein
MGALTEPAGWKEFFDIRISRVEGREPLLQIADARAYGVRRYFTGLER